MASSNETEDRRNPAAVELSRLAAIGRKKIPPKRRREIATHASHVRWAKAKHKAKRT